MWCKLLPRKCHWPQCLVMLIVCAHFLKVVPNMRWNLIAMNKFQTPSLKKSKRKKRNIFPLSDYSLNWFSVWTLPLSSPHPLLCRPYFLRLCYPRAPFSPCRPHSSPVIPVLFFLKKKVPEKGSRNLLEPFCDSALIGFLFGLFLCCPHLPPLSSPLSPCRSPPPPPSSPRPSTALTF